MSINTGLDWWDLLDENWRDIRLIFWRFLRMGECKDIDGKKLRIPLAVHVDELKEQGSIEMTRYLNAAWGSAPDSPEIHAIPGWGVLCDLCSEAWALDVEEEDAG